MHEERSELRVLPMDPIAERLHGIVSHGVWALPSAAWLLRGVVGIVTVRSCCFTSLAGAAGCASLYRRLSFAHVTVHCAAQVAHRAAELMLDSHVKAVLEVA